MVKRRTLTSDEQATLVRMAEAGATNAEIGKVIGLHPTDVSRAKPDRLKRPRKGQSKASQITVPLGSGPVPDFEEKVSVQLSHDQFVALGQHPTIVAGMMMAEKEQTETLRQRILKTVAEDGPFQDVLTLMRAMRRPGDPNDNFDSHEVTHIIKSLNKQGLVTYVERRSAGGGLEIPNRITITNRGCDAAGLPTYNREIGKTRNGVPQHKTDRTDFRTHRPRAEGGEIIKEPLAPDHLARFPGHADLHGEPIASPAPEERPEKPLGLAVRALPPDAAKYPLLTEVLRRFEANAEADAKAAKYAEAAAALEAIDPARSEELLALAMEVGGKPFTPLEIEVLKYVREVTGE